MGEEDYIRFDAGNGIPTLGDEKWTCDRAYAVVGRFVCEDLHYNNNPEQVYGAVCGISALMNRLIVAGAFQLEKEPEPKINSMTGTCEIIFRPEEE